VSRWTAAPRVPSGYGSRGMNMRKTTLR